AASNDEDECCRAFLQSSTTLTEKFFVFANELFEHVFLHQNERSLVQTLRAFSTRLFVMFELLRGHALTDLMDVKIPRSVVEAVESFVESKVRFACRGSRAAGVWPSRLQTCKRRTMSIDINRATIDQRVAASLAGFGVGGVLSLVLILAAVLVAIPLAAV